MQKISLEKLAYLTFSILVICFAVVSISLAAFGPTAPPPQNDVAAPLNVGGAAQGKLGNLGVGTTTPAATLDVEGTVRLKTGTAPAANKCLLSTNTSGDANWATCPTGPGGAVAFHINSTSTLAPGTPASVSINNKTTQTDIWLDFGIPKGADGAAGVDGKDGIDGGQGPQGPPGPQGPSAPALPILCNGKYSPGAMCSMSSIQCTEGSAVQVATCTVVNGAATWSAPFLSNIGCGIGCSVSN